MLFILGLFQVNVLFGFSFAHQVDPGSAFNLDPLKLWAVPVYKYETTERLSSRGYTWSYMNGNILMTKEKFDIYSTEWY